MGQRNAQAFTTGSNASGYTLESVEVVFAESISSANIGDISVGVWTANATGDPLASVHALTNPVSATGKMPATFTALTNATLDANTTYVVRVANSGSTEPDTLGTDLDAEDASGAPGWSIANALRVFDATWVESSGGYSNYIRINGAVRPPPDPGAPEITGAAQVGQTLTAGMGTIADTDGLPSTTFPTGYSFQWVRVMGMTETDITGATSRTYTLATADLGRTVKVKVSFTDGGGTREERPSAATAEVVAAARACTPGNIWCATLTVGQKTDGSGRARGYCDSASGRCPATEEYGSLTDNNFTLDSTNYVVESLRWGPNSSFLHLTLNRDFPGATLPRLALKVDSHVFSQRVARRGNENNNVDNNYSWGLDSIKGQDAILEYPVGLQVTVEFLPNNLATGAPTITGAAQVGQTLTASTADIRDTDGLSGVSYNYRWLREDADGNNSRPISGANSRTYTLVTEDDGKRMRVRVTFEDDEGNTEQLLSEPTFVVGNNVPEFSATTLTRSIPQNSGPNVNAGPPIPAATDADNNPLVYSMSGPDAASFAFDASTRQISTISGVTYSRATYSVVVEANDGEGGTGAVTVTIRTLDPNLPSLPSVGRSLVSNVGQNHLQDIDSASALNRYDIAQVFTTGDDAMGYKMTAADIFFNTSKPSGYVYTVGIWTANSSGRPDTQVGTLTNPAFSNAAYFFEPLAYAAPGEGIDLAANTTYVLVLDVTNVGNSSPAKVIATQLNGEDAGAGSGWSIADGALSRDWNSTGGWSTNSYARKIRIRGYGNTAGPNTVPVFADAALTRSIPQNSPVGSNIGAPIPAAIDVDDDTLTYTMEGADADSFEFDARDRRISTKDGVTYDRSSYSVTIRVTDGTDSDTVAVTIEFTDEEVDDTPPALVSATVDGAVLVLTFDEPLDDTAAGTPAPNDFEVFVNEVRVYVDSLALSGATVTLMLVDAVEVGDAVEVEYLGPAKDKDPGLQDPTGNRTPSFGDLKGVTNNTGRQANAAPVFPDTMLTRSIPANSPAHTNVGAPIPAATDADNDPLAYSMEGADATLFEFDLLTRQIATKDGVTYDQSSYSVTIRVTDGIDSHTAEVTIGFAEVDATPPALVSATVNGAVLVLTFDEPLADTAAGTPGRDDFEVLVNSARVNVRELALSGAMVTLTLETPVRQGDTISVRYTGSALQDPGGERTPAFPAPEDVTNDTVPGANNAPVFPDTTLTFSIPEDIAEGAHVGTAIPEATDADNDALFYSMEGADAASFEFDPTTRQITTKTGVTYARPSYAVTIRVTDGTDSDTVAVTIDVTDANAPAAPTAPGVRATPGLTTSLEVSWSAPDNAGKPAIESYDLRYRVQGAPAWTDGPQDVTETTAAIPGLTPGTEYQVQVRATNVANVDGGWSLSGTGRTGSADAQHRGEHAGGHERR